MFGGLFGGYSRRRRTRRPVRRRRSYFSRFRMFRPRYRRPSFRRRYY